MDGRRSAFVNPVRYAVGMSLLAFAVSGLFPSVTRAGVGGFVVPRHALQAWFGALASLPVFLLILRNWYAGSGRNLAEIGVLLLYLFGHWMFALLAIFRPIIEYGLPRTEEVNFIGLVVLWLILLPLYLTHASKAFFRAGTMRAAAGSALCIFGCVTLLMAALYLGAFGHT